jgi:hypothetical protein
MRVRWTEVIKGVWQYENKKHGVTLQAYLDRHCNWTAIVEVNLCGWDLTTFLKEQDSLKQAKAAAIDIMYRMLALRHDVERVQK